MGGRWSDELVATIGHDEDSTRPPSRFLGARTQVSRPSLTFAFLIAPITTSVPTLLAALPVAKAHSSSAISGREDHFVSTCFQVTIVAIHSGIKGSLDDRRPPPAPASVSVGRGFLQHHLFDTSRRSAHRTTTTRSACAPSIAIPSSWPVRVATATPSRAALRTATLALHPATAIAPAAP